MKKYGLLIAVLLLCVGSLFGGATFKDGSLQGRSDGSNVYVQWGTASESSVRSFAVERRAGSSGEFVEIGVLPPRGGNSDYEFIDRSAFKAESPTATLYQYRVKVTDEDGTVNYSKMLTVSHNVSSVKRTWGSLKAMFR
ncbi:MAG: hypothetical protein NTV54_06240 [Ignavibacteriales bacterium]|nr:hypothetical protein [Ignavibacteriales bacterium]